MNVMQLIEKLQEYQPYARVILAEELGASELEGDNIGFEEMNYIEYPPYWKHHPPSFNWEYPSEYKRKVLKTEKVVVIS